MPPADPNSPNSQYDFILKGDQQSAAPQQPLPAGKFFLPKKTIFIAVGILFLLVIGLIIFSSLSKNNGPSDQLVAAMGTAQEISRVSELVNQASKDSATLGLVATTSSAMASEQAQFATYAAKAGLKYDTKQLALYVDPKIDASLESAEQNNTVESTYYDFLKIELAKYQTHLKALSGTHSKTLQSLLEESYTSTQNILAAPQLAQN